jgi:hypothetical protein
VPHGCRIQTHRSRSRYRHGFERALAHSAWVVQFGKEFLKSLSINMPPLSLGYLQGVT